MLSEKIETINFQTLQVRCDKNVRKGSKILRKKEMKDKNLRSGKSI